MFVLAAAGILLIVLPPLVARLTGWGRGADSTAITRILQLIGFVLLVGALFARPYNPDTAAVPPPPDAVGGGGP